MRFVGYWTLAGITFAAGFLAVKAAKIGVKLWLLSLFG
jgi:hypothetical protein